MKYNSQNMKTNILFVLFLFLFGCSENDDSGYEPNSIVQIQISQEQLMGNENVPQQNIVINDAVAWESLKVSMHDRVQFFTETQINFDEFIILAVFDKVYPYGGHSIDITSVMEHQSNVVVKVERLLPGGAQAAIGQPYHIVKIPITSKPVIFETMFED